LPSTQRTKALLVDWHLARILSEIFPTKVRYSVTGSKVAPAWFLVAAAAVARVAMLASRQTPWGR
jgi:hypothetical protein